MEINFPMTEKFAEFVSNFDRNLITSGAVANAKRSIKDTIGVMLGSSADKIIEPLKKFCQTIGGNPQAHIIGDSNKTSFINAGMTNAAMAHISDFDDCALFGHAGTIFVPTLLALGEWQKLSGRFLIEGFVVGFEMGSRIGTFIGEKYFTRGWHSTATLGTIAATACTGYLLKLNMTQMQHAFGIAAAQTAIGFQANFGSETKSLSPAVAVANALRAAYLAKEGLTANPHIFEAARGYFSIFAENETDYASMLKELNHAPLQIENPGLWIKEWPCCYSLNPAIRLVQQLKNQLETNQIASIEYRAEHTDGFLNNPRLKNLLEAKFSLQFILAEMLLHGTITEKTFSENNIYRSEVQSLMQKVVLKKLNKNEKGFYLDIIMHSGEKYQAQVKDMLTSLTDRAIENKFQINAAKVLPSKIVCEVSDLITKFEELKDITVLMKHLSETP